MARSAKDFEQGVAAFNGGDFELAVACFSRIPATDHEQHPRALSYLGRSCWKLGDAERAIGYFQEALARLPGIEVMSELAEALLNAGRMSEAEPLLRRILALDSRHSETYIRLGMLCQHQQRLPEAVQCFERATLLDARALVPRFYLAQCCLALGNKQRAISQLHFVLRIRPNYRPARLLRADIFQSLADHRQALVELCRLEEEGPADPAVYTRMATSFLALEDRRQAMFAYEKAFRLSPDRLDAGLEATRMREKIGHFRTARDLARLMARSAPENPEVRELLERLEQKLGIGPAPEGQAPVLNPIGDPSDDDEPDIRFDPPPIQFEPAPTQPLAGQGKSRTAHLNVSYARTAPLHPPEPSPHAPTLMQHFIAGMMEFFNKGPESRR